MQLALRDILNGATSVSIGGNDYRVDGCATDRDGHAYYFLVRNSDRSCWTLHEMECHLPLRFAGW